MAADWISKRHDTKRVLETNIGPAGLLTAWLAATLTDISNGVAGTGLTCIVRAAAADGKTPLAGEPKLNKAATVVTPADGLLRYQPVAADVDTSGTYLVEWEVKDADGRTDTYPTNGYNVWQILDDLDNAP